MYRIITFLSAFILFGLQPLLGRAILPLFGGGAGVWLACMVFFQMVLLIGYAYAHGLVMKLPTQRIRSLHGGVLVLSLLLMALGWAWSGAPFLPSLGVPGASLHYPPLAITIVLGLTAGLPLMVLSTTSPLIQAIYRRAENQDPYPLYAVSNIGSLCGLLTYPLLLEPWLGLHIQAYAATGLFLCYLGLLLYVLMKKLPSEGTLSNTTSSSAITPEEAAKAPEGSPIIWVALSALGSIWLLSVSNYLSILVASMPFLWVPPLALYLVTFIWAFEGRSNPRAPWIRAVALAVMVLFSFASASIYVFGPIDKLLSPIFPHIGSLLVALHKAYHQPVLPKLLLSLAAMFLGCLLIHGRLRELRPEPSRLTAFFLWISIGGVLGGLFVGVVAPLVFNQGYELGIATILTAGLFLMDYLKAKPRPDWRGWGPASIALLFAMTALGGQIMNSGQSSRDFFGITTVGHPHPNLITMTHGLTRHGLQLVKQPLLPTAYYGETSGFGRVIRHLQSRKPALNIGIVGLGVGNAAAFGRPADRFAFYEISPKVIQLAGLQGTAFTVLKSCPSKVTVLEGDGRRLLEHQIGVEEPLDLLLIDAFAGGHIPSHLLTVEALRIYLRRLKPDGILVLHVSHHLPLHWVAAAGLRDLNLFSLMLWSNPQVVGKDSTGRTIPLEFTSTFWAASRDPRILCTPELLDACSGILATPEQALLLTHRDQPKLAQALNFSHKLHTWTDERNSLTDLLIFAARYP